MTDEILTEQGIAPEDATEEQYDQAFTTAQQRAEQLNKRDLDERVAHYRQQDQTEWDEAGAEEPDEQPPPEAALTEAEIEAEQWEEADGPGLGTVFFKTMFGFIDIVFILLAIVSAAKVAGNGISFGKG